jgi:hypothetical protein
MPQSKDDEEKKAEMVGSEYCHTMLATPPFADAETAQNVDRNFARGH